MTLPFPADMNLIWSCLQPHDRQGAVTAEQFAFEDATGQAPTAIWCKRSFGQAPTVQQPFMSEWVAIYDNLTTHNGNPQNNINPTLFSHMNLPACLQCYTNTVYLFMINKAKSL